MTQLSAAYVPDDLWSKFRSGEIDHFEYETPAVAIYADGHRETFDATVTPEILQIESERAWASRLARPHVLFMIRSSAVVDKRNFRPVVVGIVE